MTVVLPSDFVRSLIARIDYVGIGGRKDLEVSLNVSSKEYTYITDTYNKLYVYI